MSQCPNCFLDLSLHGSEDGVCPNCGRAPLSANKLSAVPVGPGASMSLVSRFIENLKDLVLRPAYFFETNAEGLLSESGLSTALTFAVIVQWLAAFFNFIWRSTLGVLVQRRLEDLFRIAGEVVQGRNADTLEELRDRAIEFFFGAGTIVITPFLTLIKLMFLALLVHAAVRFFFEDKPGRKHSYATTLKILSYASAPWILCIIPGVGMLIGWVLSFVCGVIGLREVYKSTTGRAVLAASFPELLLLCLLALSLLVLTFFAVNILRMVF